jgi:hypothetical protein
VTVSTHRAITNPKHLHAQSLLPRRRRCCGSLCYPNPRRSRPASTAAAAAAIPSCSGTS